MIKKRFAMLSYLVCACTEGSALPHGRADARSVLQLFKSGLPNLTVLRFLLLGTHLSSRALHNTAAESV